MPPIARKPPIIFRATRKSSDDANFVDFQTFTHRLRKTLHYGRLPTTDRPSLPMTELAVELFSQAVPDGLGRIDLDSAASVSRNACISPCSMILAMAYIERLRHRRPEYLQHVSSSDLFLVSMMVASKFLYDEGEDEEVFNDEWAASADMEVQDVNLLEMNFLRAIDWQLYVDPVTFGRLLKKTECTLALRKVRQRGWATYTEMQVLMDGGRTGVTYRKILSEYVLKVVAVGAVAYIVSIMTLIGATLIAKQVRQLSLGDSCSSPLRQLDATAMVPSEQNMSTPHNTSSCCSSVVDLESLELNFVHNLNDHQLPSAMCVLSSTQPPWPPFCRHHLPPPSSHLGFFRRRHLDSLLAKRPPDYSNWSSFSFHPKTVFINTCI